MRHLLTVTLCAVLLTLAPQPSPAAPDSAPQSRPATAPTRAAHAAQHALLDADDGQDWQDAHRGYVAPLPDMGRILDSQGRETWNLAPYAFLSPGMTLDYPPSRILPTDAPDTVNPSLWRQSQLVLRDGLYKVVDGLYQIRNADLANMTIIEGQTGLIVVDPLLSSENAAAALNLYYAHRPRRPVRAVIYSHSHAAHYGGAAGVVSAEDVSAGRVEILAPQGFMAAALRQGAMTGPITAQRARYLYGTSLPPSPRGHVGSGLGLTLSQGTRHLLAPTRLIRHDEQLTLDGLTFIFQLTPDTEAPAEMHWYIPQLKALTTAENCPHTMHSLSPLYGGAERDPLRWSQALDESLQRWGQDAEVLYSMHHWPVWGKARVRQELGLMRDLYRYIHDQTLHLANQGYSMLDIAESLRLPPELARPFSLRGYYGTLSQNVKSVYTRYLGWFDGNPAHLHPLSSVAAARKYVAYMGGADAILQRARKDYDAGEYRWVAQVLQHVILVDPQNMAARMLAADALEQLGYQAESGPWRNAYLSGARDLRGLPPHQTAQMAVPGTPQIQAMPAALYFAYLGVRLDGVRAQGQQLCLRIHLTDTGESWDLRLGNSVLHARRAADTSPPHLRCTRQQMLDLFEGRLSPEQAHRQGLLTADAPLEQLLALLTTFRQDVSLVLPRTDTARTAGTADPLPR